MQLLFLVFYSFIWNKNQVGIEFVRAENFGVGRQPAQYHQFSEINQNSWIRHFIMTIMTL